MSVLLLYLAKSTLSISILFLCYYFILKRDPLFQFNRFFLLFGLIIASLLPFIDYNVLNILITGPIEAQAFLITYQLPEYILNEVTITDSSGGWNLSTAQWILLIYFTGLTLKLMHLVFRIIQIQHLKNENTSITQDGLQIVLSEKDIPTFSFFNMVFIQKDDFEHEKIDAIIKHERVHIKQWHSLDLIIVEMIAILQWFNPFVYLLKRSIQDNHEFIADSAVVKSTLSQSMYKLLLIEQSTQIKTNTLVHNFSYSLLKRRLFMMNKRKNPIRTGIGLISAIMAIGLVVFACSAPTDIESPMEEGMNQTETVEDVFSVVEVMPEFPGGMEALATYLGSNIEYPKEAKDKEVSGKVFVNFIVEKDGSVNNAKVIRGIGSGCDKEAIRVVSSMPDWTPGMQRGQNVRVSFNLPIAFQLGGEDTVKDSIFTVVDEMPQFPGGNQALMTYLGGNIKYPEQAKKEKISGRVFVSFVVEKDGAVSNVNVLRGIGSGCDEESVRVIAGMPNWEPGKDENGKEVRVKYNIPIKYTLD